MGLCCSVLVIVAGALDCRPCARAAHPRCNTLQHTALHCNTLQLIVLVVVAGALVREGACNTTVLQWRSKVCWAWTVLQCIAVCCGVLQCCAVCCRRPCARGPRTLTATYCSTLQPTTTHCNTLQHTATQCMLQALLCARVAHPRCTTLHHTATHCDTLQHTATHRNTLQHTATHCMLQASLPRTLAHKEPEEVL